MKKILLLLLIGIVPFFLFSCTKSGALTGGSASGGSSFGGSINGSVNGGLSGVANASVSLMTAGNPTPLASANTGTDGSFNLVFTNPGGNSLLYLVVSGGNAGNGTNGKNQFLSIAGTTGALFNTLRINELTTAATELVAMNLGILNDTSGSVTLNAPKNAAGANNAAAQFSNLISAGKLNTANANLTSSTQTGLNAMANAFAACIESPSNCAGLFSAAASSTGASASTLLESGYNALTNSANNANSIYTLAFPLSSNTGFSLSSSSTPSGFSFNNPLAISLNTFPVTSAADVAPVAVDASGNIWIGNAGNNTINEVSPAGALLGSFSASDVNGIGIDAAGNVWTVSQSGVSVTELNSSGRLIGTYSISAASLPTGLEIDPSGNVWVATFSSANVIELNSSGTVIGNFPTGATGTFQLAIDGSGNVWIERTGNSVIKLSSSGGSLLSFSTLLRPVGIAFDSSGNMLMAACYTCYPTSGHIVAKYSTSGSLIAEVSTGTVSTTAGGLVLDSLGNVWLANNTLGITEINSSLTAVLANYSLGATPSGQIAIDQSGNVWAPAGNNLGFFRDFRG